jgi:hypothetical protein
VVVLTNIGRRVRDVVRYHLTQFLLVYGISIIINSLYCFNFPCPLEFLSSLPLHLQLPALRIPSLHSHSTNQSRLLLNISFEMANLKVTLINPLGSTSPCPHEAIRVSRHSDGETQKLEMSLRRTIRAPDNGGVYELPPDMGAFPIYNIREYDSKLPLALVEKGGVSSQCFVR